MRSRFTRLGVVAFGLLALLGTTTPVKADTVLVAHLVASVTVHDGMGYPITTLPTPEPHILSPFDGYTLLETLAHLKGAEHVCDLPLPNGFLDDDECLTNSHWVYDHPRVISASSFDCVDVAVNVDKLTKAPLHAGTCVFQSINRPGLPNIVTGHCTQQSGQMQWIYTDALGQDFLLDLHFKQFYYLYITGHWFKIGTSQHGLIIGVFDVSPEIVIGGPSCTNKSQENFLWTGVAAAVTDPTL